MADNAFSKISNAAGRIGEAVTSDATTRVKNLMRQGNSEVVEQSATSRATNALRKRADTALKTAIGSATGPLGTLAYSGAKKVLANPLVQAVLIGGFVFMIGTIADVISNPVQFFLDNREAIQNLSSTTSQSQTLDYYVSNHSIASAGDSLGLSSSTPSINWTTVCDYLGANEAINDRAKQIALATQDASAPVFQVCLAAKVAAQILSKN
jgi:hypothetical protein